MERIGSAKESSVLGRCFMLGQQDVERSYIALCIGEFMIEFGLGMGIIFLAVWMNSTITIVEIGIISTATNLVGTFSLMFWGWFCNRYGRFRLVVTLGLAIMGIIYPLYIVSNSFLMFLLLGLLSGFIRSMFLESAPLQALVTGIIGPRKMGKRYGEWRMWGTVGWIVAALLEGILVSQFGIPVAFAIGSIANLATALIVILYVEEGSGISRPSKGHKSQIDLRKYLWDVKQRNLLVFTIATALTGLVSATYGFFSLYMRRIGSPDTLIGLAHAVGAVVEVPVMIYAGSLSDKIGRRETIIFSYFMTTVHLFLMGLFPDPYLVMTAFSLKGVGYGIGYTVTTVYVAEEAQDRRTLVFGVVNSLKSIGIVIGPYIVATLADIGGMANMFLIMAAYSLIPAVLFMLGTHSTRSSQPNLRQKMRLKGRDA